MAEATPDRDAVEALLDLGLRNLWYPVCPSYQVGTAPAGFTRLGERIVLWRDHEGIVHAMEDRCPHRGARLSLGWNLGDRIACWYHGIEITGEGRVARVPAVGSCPLEGQACVRTYPVREIQGAVFAWFGDGSGAEPKPLELPEELVSDEHSAFLCTAQWRCNYRYAIDNVMDPMHGAYLHAASHSMAEGDKSAVMRVKKTPSGIMFEKAGQRDVNFDWVEWGDTGAHWMRLAIPYRKDAGPGGSFSIVGFVTPVDRDHCRVFFWRVRRVQGWQRDVWRFLYRTRLEVLHWEVLEQDRIVLGEMAATARAHEFLYQHDTGLAHVRRLMQAEAVRQVAARQARQAQAAE